jgi:4-hydroxy-3-polyprenylbenzoate decarboxylase
MIEFNDLREWLKLAEEMGEVKSIEGADPHLEIGTMVQINGQNQGPALLFDKVKGYREGFRILTNSMANIKTVNLTFGIPTSWTIREAVENLKVKAGEWADQAKNFPYEIVPSGPITENVEKGEEVNLDKFPVPLWHELDGGRYIGTGVGVITRDPDTGWINMGTYRVQQHDDKRVGFYISPGKHSRIHRDTYFARGESCPVAMVFGSDPLNYILSASEIPHGICEFDYMGAIRGKAVPMIKGRVTGLPIPANAEIAVEGIANPKDLKFEGPFGEWTGTYASKGREEPFIKVETLYYRNNPVLLGSPPSKGLASDQGFWRAVWRSALVYNEIERAGIPGITGVWCPAFGGSRLFTIVAVKQSYPGHATEAGHIASQTRAGAYLGRYVVVVDEDINPYDIEDVMWAICTRSDPKEMDIIKRAWSGPLDPRIRKPTDDYTNSHGIIYAVKPYEWYNDFPPTSLNSEKLRREVFNKWTGQFGGRWKDI